MNLRYCPFCGSDNIELDQVFFGYRFICEDCGAIGSEAETIKEARALWNQRVNEETLEEE
jgi:Lar family restriction alleviation protein